MAARALGDRALANRPETSGYGPHDRARRSPEPPKDTGGGRRRPFSRDRARVLHSAALRRLAGKTQVVGPGEGAEVSGVPRTRLTHSLEVAQIGREMAEELGCDPDVVDLAGLAHDIGHPPFGHNGERALDEFGAGSGVAAGFEGNAQTLRILTRLEPKIGGSGLNLTRASLDATCKYPWIRADGDRKYGAYPEDAGAFDWVRDGAPARRRCIEAQVMDWADDVAYSVHDVEDGLHAGLVSLAVLRDPAERALVSRLARDAYCKPEWAVPAAELEAVFTEFLALPFWDFTFDGGYAALVAAKTLTSKLVGRLVGAAFRATLDAHVAASNGAAAPGVVTVPDVLAAFRLTRYAADLVVPRRQLLECALLKAVAARYVMGREGADAQQAGERELIAELALAIYRGAPAALDPVLRRAWDAAESEPDPERARRRVVIDQVASLTDTSAIAWHRRLCA
jgi:dGTPase